MSTNKEIKFDVMLRDRFVATFRMPLYMADDYQSGRHIVSVETLCNYAERMKPTLKGEPYRIRF